MLGRLYTVLFILTIILSLCYQRVYLNKSAVEFNAQIMAENTVLPTIIGKNYNSLSFQNGVFKSSFSGKNIIYFSNKHFEATDNLIYQEVDNSPHNFSASNLNTNDILIKTSKAVGEVVSSQPDSSHVLMGKNKLKYVILPNIVNFNFSNNIGKTSDVYIDAIKKTLQSENPIDAQGPSGNIKGIGFFYSMNKDEFIIKSDVEGTIIPAQVPKN